MKIRFSLLITGILLFMFVCSNGQISPKIYIDKANLPTLTKRPLIIALMEENPEAIEKLEKKAKKNPDGVANYRASITAFNEYLKSSMDKYWKLNDNESYEYKEFSEVIELMKSESKSKSKKYSVLLPGYLHDTDIEPTTWAAVSIPVFIYTRAEQPIKKPDYKIYIPNSGLRNGVKNTQSDIDFALIALQDNINYMNDKKAVMNFDEYVHAKATENCEKIKGMKILVDKALIDPKLKEPETKMKAEYKGDMQIVDAEEIKKAFEEKRENTVVVMCIPYEVLEMQSANAPVNSTFLVSAKVAIDCNTKEIINEHDWEKSGKDETGKTIGPYIQPKNIKGLSECKQKNKKKEK